MSATSTRALRGIALALTFFLLPQLQFAQSAAALAAGAASDPGRQKPLGSIDYVRGSVSIVRDGDALPDSGPGDPVYSGDLIRTGATSTASIAMDPSSGFSGSILISPGSAFYLGRNMVQDQPKTKLDLMAGSLSAKITKIAGSPGLDVNTGSSVFGVRGTEFQIALSLNNSLLAVCITGLVAVTRGEDVTALPAGQAIQQSSGEAFTPVAADLASIRDLKDRWIENEGEAFRHAPLKALSVFEKIYSEHAKILIEDGRKLALDPVFRKWLEEHRANAIPNPMSPQVLREKKDMAPKLIAMAKRLAMFERVWWRLRDMVEVVRSAEFSKQEIRKGLFVAQFVQSFDRDKRELERSIFIYRKALGLYLERSPDSEDFVTTLVTGGSE